MLVTRVRIPPVSADVLRNIHFDFEGLNCDYYHVQLHVITHNALVLILDALEFVWLTFEFQAEVTNCTSSACTSLGRACVFRTESLYRSVSCLLYSCTLQGVQQLPRLACTYIWELG